MASIQFAKIILKQENKPKALIGFIHGKLTLENIFAFQNKFSAFIDVSESGIGDLYYDFVKAIRGTVQSGCYFQNASSSINYCECHDNFTLYDKLKITNAANSEEQRNKIQLCCIASILFAQGILLLHRLHGLSASAQFLDERRMLLLCLAWIKCDMLYRRILSEPPSFLHADKHQQLVYKSS